MKSLHLAFEQLKEKMFLLILPHTKLSDADIEIFIQQLSDRARHRCTATFKGAQDLFRYFRAEMDLYGLPTVEALCQHLTRSEKRSRARIGRYLQAGLLDKISMEWNASRVFELFREETSQSHPAAICESSSQLGGNLQPAPRHQDAATAARPSQQRKRNQQKSESCY